MCILHNCQLCAGIITLQTCPLFNPRTPCPQETQAPIPNNNGRLCLRCFRNIHKAGSLATKAMGKQDEGLRQAEQFMQQPGTLLRPLARHFSSDACASTFNPTHGGAYEQRVNQQSPYKHRRLNSEPMPRRGNGALLPGFHFREKIGDKPFMSGQGQIGTLANAHDELVGVQGPEVPRLKEELASKVRGLTRDTVERKAKSLVISDDQNAASKTSDHAPYQGISSTLDRSVQPRAPTSSVPQPAPASKTQSLGRRSNYPYPRANRPQLRTRAMTYTPPRASLFTSPPPIRPGATDPLQRPRRPCLPSFGALRAHNDLHAALGQPAGAPVAQPAFRANTIGRCVGYHPLFTAADDTIVAPNPVASQRSQHEVQAQGFDPSQSSTNATGAGAHTPPRSGSDIITQTIPVHGTRDLPIILSASLVCDEESTNRPPDHPSDPPHNPPNNLPTSQLRTPPSHTDAHPRRRNASAPTRMTDTYEDVYRAPGLERPRHGRQPLWDRPWMRGE